ncbi:uncharacterized protein LOC34620592 [Cyclospora cayetanensis]|uniref:Uncharacterized protein LOC34620592 n=1 Tax=Cyclospora cayetanensis TaxID=88456 RepID=A0A6P6RQ10_9EIME|nr:uncharacterized protein LOC34620592 [Cyclospora cayetanensis]
MGGRLVLFFLNILVYRLRSTEATGSAGTHKCSRQQSAGFLSLDRKRFKGLPRRLTFLSAAELIALAGIADRITIPRAWATPGVAQGEPGSKLWSSETRSAGIPTQVFTEPCGSSDADNAAHGVGAAPPATALGGALAATSAGAGANALAGIPITSLRTACRKLQLPSKGKRVELLSRLQQARSLEELLALVRPNEVPPAPPDASQEANKVQEPQMEISRKPAHSRCHKCNHRLSSKARFCSKCGATICSVGQETLREFVEKAFWPIREQEVGSNTMRVERGFWQSILQVIGDVPVANLSAAVWEEYLRALKKRNCSPRTQVLHQVAYLAALKYAVHTRRLEGIHDFRKIRGCTKRTLVSVPLTAEEVYLLLAATPKTMHCALFAVGIGAGLRPSEIVSMRWEDINMQEMTTTVRGSKTAASAAVIPLTNLAARELMRWWEEEGKPTSGLCFYVEGIRSRSSRINLRTKTPIRSFKKALQAAAHRAGIDETRCGEPRRVFPYILRHSFATIAATSNPPVPLPVAQAVMRHTSSKMLLETYAKAGALVIKEGLRNFKI